MDKPDRPLADVMHDILRNLRDIAKSEIRLAKAEVREETGKVKTAVALIATGAFFSVFALLFLLLAGFHWLAQIMPEWQAALVVAGGLLALTLLFVLLGVNLLNRMHLTPMKTLRSIKRNFIWARAHQK